MMSVLLIGKVGPNDGTAPVNPAVQARIVAGYVFAVFSRAGNQELPVLSKSCGRIPGAVRGDVQIQHRSVLQKRPSIRQGGLVVRAKVILDLFQRPSKGGFQVLNVGTGANAGTAALPAFVG
jgi:hypothetical protein